MNQTIKNLKTKLLIPKKITEVWTDIELDNGDLIRAKIVVAAVLQVYNEDGTPAKMEGTDTNLYALNSQLITATFGKDQVTTMKEKMN